jgi:DNA polymerase III delta subunit
MDRGSDRAEVMRAMNVRGRAQEATIAAAIRTDTRKLVAAIDKLARTDLAIKTSKGGSGPAAARMQLEMLVCELALD